MLGVPMLDRHPRVAPTDPRADSPRCLPRGELLHRLGLEPDLRSCWLHLGPIGAGQTRLVAHGDLCAKRAPRRGRWSLDDHLLADLLVASWPEHRGYEGWYVDLFCLPKPPPRIPTARPIGEAFGSLGPLYAVAGAVWTDRLGPYSWFRCHADVLAVKTGTVNAVGRPRTAADARLLEHGLELIEGRRHGRRPRWQDEKVRQIVADAHRLLRAHPYLTQEALAIRLNVPVRTLREYLRDPLLADPDMEDA